MPPSLYRVLKVTTTRTFSMENLDELKINTRALDLEPHRAVLRKMLPEFAERELEPWVCPFALQHFAIQNMSNYSIVT
jgi:hypothetical protein